MAKYEQGTAPSVVFENEEVVFVFRESKPAIRGEMVRENGGKLELWSSLVFRKQSQMTALLSSLSVNGVTDSPSLN